MSQEDSSASKIEIGRDWKVKEVFDYLRGSFGLVNDLSYQKSLWENLDEKAQKERREEVLLRLLSEGYDLDEVFLGNELALLGDLDFDFDLGKIRAEIESIRYKVEDHNRSKRDIAYHENEEGFAKLLALMAKLSPEAMFKVLSAIISGTEFSDLSDPSILSEFIDKIEELFFEENPSIAQEIDEQWELEMEEFRGRMEGVARQEEAKELALEEAKALIRIEMADNEVEEVVDASREIDALKMESERLKKESEALSAQLREEERLSDIDDRRFYESLPDSLRAIVDANGGMGDSFEEMDREIEFLRKEGARELERIERRFEEAEIEGDVDALQDVQDCLDASMDIFRLERLEIEAERDALEQDLEDNYGNDEEFDEIAAKIVAKNKDREVNEEEVEARPEMLSRMLDDIRGKVDAQRGSFVEVSAGDEIEEINDDHLNDEEMVVLEGLKERFSAVDGENEGIERGLNVDEVERPLLQNEELASRGVVIQARLALARIEKAEMGVITFDELERDENQGEVLAGFTDFKREAVLARQDLEVDVVLEGEAKDELAFFEEIEEVKDLQESAAVSSLKERFAAIKARGTEETPSTSVGAPEVQSFADRLAAIKARGAGGGQDVEVVLEEKVEKPGSSPVAHKDVRPGSSVSDPSLASRLAALGIGRG